MGASGPVLVKGRRDKAGNFETLVVKAFGKNIEIPKPLLARIPNGANGIQLSYEAGYKQLGGRTIYILFLTGFTSVIKEKMILSVNEDGQSKAL